MQASADEFVAKVTEDLVNGIYKIVIVKGLITYFYM